MSLLDNYKYSVDTIPKLDNWYSVLSSCSKIEFESNAVIFLLVCLALDMDLYLYILVTSCIGYLENIGSLNYADFPYVCPH